MSKKTMEIIDYYIIDLVENHIGRVLDSVRRFSNIKKKNKANKEKQLLTSKRTSKKANIIRTYSSAVHSSV